VEQAVQAFDWNRMIFGDEPPLFLLEIAFRTAVVYVYALLLLRWLGSRTIGQLSTIEFLLVIALGSAVGDAMFYPDVPLLHALMVITVVVVANKVLDVVIAKSASAERAIDGIPAEAIRHGIVNRGFMEGSSLSDNELFQQLREHGVTHLGEVAHAYLETNGVLTVYKEEGERPGLPIMPPWELKPPQEVNPAEVDGPVACKRCGMVAKCRRDECSNCGHEVWVRARV
jgi:uncharacterized membrane protein YcaP (DUF421 family)